MLLFDYEHARPLPFVKASLGMAPSSIDHPTLRKAFRYGLREYDGLKEDVYAASFSPDSSILTDLGVGQDDILVTIRPPATEAHYHNPEAESLFVEVVNFLGATPGLRMVILPRNPVRETEFIHRTWSRWCHDGRIIIPQHVLNGLNLVWHSDLVVSGGGTMNREAAALGVPVYSIFRGKPGAVDRHLAACGRLVLIETVTDVRTKLRPVKRTKDPSVASGERPALRQILTAANELMALAEPRWWPLRRCGRTG
jgi:predicted glycosyltransferase